VIIIVFTNEETRSKAVNSALKKKFGNKDLDLIECLKLLIENNLVRYLGNTTYIAISSKVAKVFEQVFKNVMVCHDSDSMLK
jgi:adenosyl cobinamide kinase/adenosyl cobinamide phosphate guanylyltransferase